MLNKKGRELSVLLISAFDGKSCVLIGRHGCGLSLGAGG